MEAPRETAIVTAVNFLKNPKVERSTLFQKRNFLASKGLTDGEIQQAFERVGIFVAMTDLNENKDETRINVQPPSTYRHQMTRFEKIKDIISSAALISGIAYAIYRFYKKFIEPLLFGRKKGDKIDEMAKTTKAINGELIRVRDELNKQKQTTEENHKVLQNTMQSFKQEMETIKGILLNRKQFSSPSVGGIPSWQLNSKKSLNQDKNDDAGSAHSTNSSENDTEVIHEEETQKRSPANSDSSLEIM